MVVEAVPCQVGGEDDNGAECECDGFQRLHSAECVQDEIPRVSEGVPCADGRLCDFPPEVADPVGRRFPTDLGGGLRQLGVQALGVLAVGGYTVLCMIPVFKLIQATVGLRAGAEEEIEGLDVTEHGLANAYADFLPIESTLGVHSDGPVDTASLAPFPLELTSGLRETGKKEVY